MLATRFDNQNLRRLPVDPKAFVVGESRQVPNAVFSRVSLQPVASPRLIAFSRSALELVGITVDDEGELAPYLAGNVLIPGSEPAAHCYCGHQFGSFAGQLGDGAAMYLGEVTTATGQRWELQLKGAGTTPYSRSSDGRKVLRSSVREFLCSEAMHNLGVPTTRAGSCATSDSTVVRDPFYDGRQINERCSIVSRIAPNFFRFGSFEIFKSKGRSAHDRAGPSAGNNALKKQLLDHVVDTYYSELRAARQGDDKDEASASASASVYREFLAANVRSTAKLVAQWQGFGFVHGVLNTDNMSVMGVTIDYGPFAFMEAFDPDFTPNGSDGSGRYAYEAQPEMVKWNLGKLGEALAPLLPEADARAAVAEFDSLFTEAYQSIMFQKIGLNRRSSSLGGKDDEALLTGLFSAMASAHTDFTDTFRALTAFREALLDPEGADASGLENILVDCLVSRSASPEELAGAMKRKLRVHRLEMQPDQIEALWGMLTQDPAAVAEMFAPGVDLEAIREQVGGERKKLHCLMHASAEIRRLEMVSASAQAIKARAVWAPWVAQYVQRVKAEPVAGPLALALLRGMQSLNPTFILRNWIAEAAIRAAERGDYSKVRTVLKMQETPFETAFCSMRPAFAAAACRVPGGTGAGGDGSSDESGKVRAVAEAEREFLVPPPAWAASLLCTCSS